MLGVFYLKVSPFWESIHRGAWVLRSVLLKFQQNLGTCLKDLSPLYCAFAGFEVPLTRTGLHLASSSAIEPWWCEACSMAGRCRTFAWWAGLAWSSAASAGLTTRALSSSISEHLPSTRNSRRGYCLRALLALQFSEVRSCFFFVFSS